MPDKRLVVFVGIVAALIVAQLLGLPDYLSLESMARHRTLLLKFVIQHPFESILIYFVVYVVLVSLSVPGSQMLTITGGFLFGTVLGAALAVAGASCGAAVLFLVVSKSFGTSAISWFGRRVERVAQALRADAWSYLLILRLLPLAPFFAVNLAAALVGVPFITFLITTTLGIIPGALAYAAFGDGLGSAVETTSEPGLMDLLTPELMIATGALCLLALAAIPVRRYITGRKS